MKYSKLFGKAMKAPPVGVKTINHRLLVQAGFVRQLMAGVYSYLPLGLRVLNNLGEVIRQEMNSIGGQEILMPSLHPAANWKTTGGWDMIDVLFKLSSRTKRQYALGQSHEEVVTPLVKNFVASYKDLPIAVYQIHWKFRDELRAKSGILRGREFQMKDMYSFHQDAADFQRFYARVKKAYLKAFDRLGLVTKVTEASGGNFTDKISYEFMVLTDAGEDDILYCDDCEFCVNTEIAKDKEGDACPKCAEGKLAAARASEVGNVFDLGEKFCRDFGLQFVDKLGERQYPVMGCYGWGTSRTMGVLVEKFHDERGIIWPQAVAPFQVHLINIGVEALVRQRTERLYDQLQKEGIEVLWDDRDESPGVKLSVADLIGCPVRLVISRKTDKKVEWKKRTVEKVELLEMSEIISKLKNIADFC